MKTLFAILAVVCVMISCSCYIFNQEEHSDTTINTISCIGSFAFIMAIMFFALIFK